MDGSQLEDTPLSSLDMLDINTNQSVLTVSLDDNLELEVLQNKTGFCSEFGAGIGRNVSVIVSLFVSLAVALMSIICISVVDQKRLSPTVWKFLMVLRHVGLYSTSGGCVTLLVNHFAFSNFSTFSVYKLRKSRHTDVCNVLYRFLLSNVFDDLFLKQYLKRVKYTSENETSKKLVSFLEGGHVDSLVSEKINSLLKTPEGFLLEALALDIDEVKAYCKSVLVSSMYDVHNQVTNGAESNQRWRHDQFRKHINNILTEKLNRLSEEHVPSLVSELASLHTGQSVAVACLMMAVVGAVVGVVLEM